MNIKKIKKPVLGIVVSALFLWMLYLVIPLPEPLFKNDYSTVIMDEDGNILRAFLNKEQLWYFPPEAGLVIPKKLKTAILMFEDRYFYKHPGVNILSLCRADYLPGS